ncbi:MAG: hypothetical protein J5589_06885 [Firmicutes bacterium]|nr:hypothetical protein [Bacillota bacterium]
METNRVKKYVTVNADYMDNGTICPHSVTLDGKMYRIDRIVRVDKGRTVRGWTGRTCYEVEIRGRRANLYLESERWYVEKKVG